MKKLYIFLIFLFLEILVAGLAYADPVTVADTINSTTRVAVQGNGIQSNPTIPQFMNGGLDITDGATGSLTGLVGRASNGQYTLVTTLSNFCSIAFSADTCAQIFGFANPTWYGGFCDEVSQNNNIHDDTNAINLALANTEKVPVLIPGPLGCKIAGNVVFSNFGQAMFEFPHAIPYDSNSRPTSPYIWIPNNPTTTSTRLAINTAGYEVVFEFIEIKGNFAAANSLNFAGPTQIGNSVGIRGAASFTLVEHFSGAGSGVIFGGNIDQTCTPVKNAQSDSAWQVDAYDVKIGSNTCYGWYGNFSDAHFDQMYLAGIQGPGFSTIPAFAGLSNVPIMASNIRCEFDGQPVAFFSNSLQKDGVCMNMEGPLEITNLEGDNNWGPLLQTGSQTKHALMTNIASSRPNLGGAAVTDQCTVALNDGTSGVVVNGIKVFNNANNAPYVLCTHGTVDNVYWRSADNTGYTTSYNNIAVPIAHFEQHIPGLWHLFNGDPIGIGTTSPITSVAMDFSGTTGAIALPSGATAQEPSPVGGEIRYNSSTHKIEAVTGSPSAWGPLGAITPSSIAANFFGLYLSNDSTTPNTVIDIAKGGATDDTASVVMSITNFTKTTGSWVAGSGNGCLDTGSVANSTWYHVYLIETADTLTNDVLCSTSSYAPAMPAGYAYKRRIGSIKTDGSAHILAFTQVGSVFYWSAPTLDVNISNLGTTSALETLNVPTGFKVQPLFRSSISNGSPADAVLLSSPDEPDIAPDVTTPFAAATGYSQLQITSAAGTANSTGDIMTTNISGQIRARATAASTSLSIITRGWVDCAGQCRMPTVTVLTSGSTYVLPSDWNTAQNMVEAIGEGGNGSNTGFGGGGGGGGAYSRISNLSDSAGTSESIQIGAGGSATTTQFKSGATLVADYGRSAVSTASGAGGSTGSSVGSIKFAGGAGTDTAGHFGGGGGGGSGGPYGAGGAGGTVATYSGGSGGAGGGGADGGSIGGNSTTGAVGPGGAGGNGRASTGGGTGGTNAAGSAGSAGGGGGGGGGPNIGGAGGAEFLWNGAYGPGGGGGGAGIAGGGTGKNGGNGAGFGGGGGGYAVGGTLGGTGGSGAIIVTYMPVK